MKKFGGVTPASIESTAGTPGRAPQKVSSAPPGEPWHFPKRKQRGKCTARSQKNAQKMYILDKMLRNVQDLREAQKSQKCKESTEKHAKMASKVSIWKACGFMREASFKKKIKNCKKKKLGKNCKNGQKVKNWEITKKCTKKKKMGCQKSKKKMHK